MFLEHLCAFYNVCILQLQQFLLISVRADICFRAFCFHVSTNFWVHRNFVVVILNTLPDWFKFSPSDKIILCVCVIGSLMKPFYNNVLEGRIVWSNLITRVIRISAILTSGKILLCVSILLWKIRVLMTIVLRG